MVAVLERPPIMDHELIDVPLRMLVPADDNPRRNLGDLEELAISIKSVGLLEPIVATPTDKGRYLVVAGHRRLAAAELAALETVPVYVRVLDDRERVAAMLVENLQRSDLQPLEEAGAFHRLIDEFGMTQRKLSEKVGRSQGHISKRLALLQLPEEIRTEVDSGGISLADAVEYSKLADHPERLKRAAGHDTWQTAADAVTRELAGVERDKKVDVVAAKLEKAGLTVVRYDDNGSYHGKLPRGVRKLTKTAGGYDYEALIFDPKKHATEACHAIAIHPSTLEEYAVCTNRKNHAGAKTVTEKRNANTVNGSGANAAKKAAEVAELRKGLEGAGPRRRQFVVELLQRKNAITKSRSLELILNDVLERADENLGMDAIGDVVDALGLPAPSSGYRGPINALREYVAANPAKLQDVAIAITLVGLDDFHGASYVYSADSWETADVDYFELLKGFGYEPNDVETTMLANAKKASR